MIVDWEDEVKFDGKKFYVQVEYDLEWDSLETVKQATIKHIRAYNDKEEEVAVPCGLTECVANIIDDEHYNR